MSSNGLSGGAAGEGSATQLVGDADAKGEVSRLSTSAPERREGALQTYTGRMD